MTGTKWFFHPIFVFIFSVVAVATSLILYIYWYVEASSKLKAMVRHSGFAQDRVSAMQTWVVILVLSVLVAIILITILIIFIYGQKTLQLYRLQRNFINNFTHELKTPVTSLKLYLETFQKHELKREDQVKYLDYMIQDTERLSNNINRILNLARIESRTYKGEFTLENLVDIVDAFCEKNRHLFAGCQVVVNKPFSGRFVCRINLALFEMLLMNLLTNAFKYNRADVPKMEISFAQKAGKLNIYFRDNGIGFPRSERKKIFRKFYQIGNSDNMSAKGSGLGLYVVENIVRIHKGKIFAESSGSGNGARFSLILPQQV